jgi:hypothetical protein
MSSPGLSRILRFNMQEYNIRSQQGELGRAKWQPWALMVRTETPEWADTVHLWWRAPGSLGQNVCWDNDLQGELLCDVIWDFCSWWNLEKGVVTFSEVPSFSVMRLLGEPWGPQIRKQSTSSHLRGTKEELQSPYIHWFPLPVNLTGSSSVQGIYHVGSHWFPGIGCNMKGTQAFQNEQAGSHLHLCPPIVPHFPYSALPFPPNTPWDSLRSRVETICKGRIGADIESQRCD